MILNEKIARADYKPDEDEDGLMVEDYYLLIAHLLAIRSSTDPPNQLKSFFVYDTQLDKHFKKMKPLILQDNLF